MDPNKIPMRRTRRYWAVCYAHVCRIAGPCPTAAQAAREAFGTVDEERMTVWEFPSNPKYMPQYRKATFLAGLFKRHEEKTGNKVG